MIGENRLLLNSDTVCAAFALYIGHDVGRKVEVRSVEFTEGGMVEVAFEDAKPLPDATEFALGQAALDRARQIRGPLTADMQAISDAIVEEMP